MIITLTTDFGLRDSFVGTMKGVILGIAPSGSRSLTLPMGSRPETSVEAPLP